MERKEESLNPTSKQNLLLSMAAVVILAGIAWVSLRTTGESAEESRAAVKRAQTLPPEMFTDPAAREAYQAAKEVPEVLEQLPCFCGCMTSFGHKNNLFCFMDEHGSACTICQNIAVDARNMHKDGLSIERIKETIVAKYAKYAP